jgi:transposase
LFLLPPLLTEWLPKNHLVFFIREVLDEMDLTPITSEYEDEERGYPPYHPKVIGVISGVFST